MRDHIVRLLMCVVAFCAAFQLDPATTSKPSAGIVFSPTTTSSAGFPIVMKYTNGTFVKTPGTYYCMFQEPDGTPNYVPAKVWGDDPTTLQCATFGEVYPATDCDVALYSNETGNFAEIASWPESFSCNEDASTTVTNRYSAVVMDPLFFNFTSSVTVSMKVTPKSGFPGLDPEVWYVCIFHVYTSKELHGEPGFFFEPENAVTNFTVVNATYGTCPSPVFSTLPADNTYPFQGEVWVVAYDASWDSSDCDSVAGFDYCVQMGTWWGVTASEIWPVDVPCIDDGSDDAYNLSLSASEPFQKKRAGPGGAHATLDYSNQDSNNFTMTSNVISVIENCYHTGVGGVYPQKVTFNVFDPTGGFGTVYPLWSGTINLWSIYLKGVAPKSGPAGTVVTMTGTFWQSASYMCMFTVGGSDQTVNVTGTGLTSTSFQCSTAGLPPKTYYVSALQSGRPVVHQSQSVFMYDVTASLSDAMPMLSRRRR